MHALVLAGGYSTRMKKDKTRITLQSGKTLLEQSISILSEFDPTITIAISCREDTNWDLPYTHIRDIYHNSGPLAGIHAALTELKTDIILLPTDTPLINTQVLTELQNAYKEYPEYLSYSYKNTTDTHSKIEPLIAIFRYQALPYIEKALAEERRKITLAIPEELQYYVPYTAESKDIFHNVNTPEDLQYLTTLQE